MRHGPEWKSNSHSTVYNLLVVALESLNSFVFQSNYQISGFELFRLARQPEVMEPASLLLDELTRHPILYNTSLLQDHDLIKPHDHFKSMANHDIGQTL